MARGLLSLVLPRGAGGGRVIVARVRQGTEVTTTGRTRVPPRPVRPPAVHAMQAANATKGELS